MTKINLEDIYPLFEMCFNLITKLDKEKKLYMTNDKIMRETVNMYTEYLTRSTNKDTGDNLGTMSVDWGGN